VPGAEGTFVSLAQLLRAEPERDVVVEALDAQPVGVPSAPALESAAALVELMRDVRVFRAHLREAFEVARDALVRELAYAVLGRELQLAPSDVGLIAARLLAEHPAAQPLLLRVAPADLAQLALQAETLPPLQADATLAPGDAVLELACGHIDARLGVRLAVVLAGRE
jgi:flagellar biosynthesis/type III secretory pathway protein FliH